MPIYIPPLVKKIAVGTTPTGLNDLSDVIVSAPTSGQGLIYNGSYWLNGDITTQVELNSLASSTAAATGSLQTQISSNDTDISNLQIQINEITTGINIVFCEEFTGNGVATTAQLDGSITNGQFISGGWSAIEVANTLPAYITDLNGSPIYNSSNIFTRTRLTVSTINSSGLVTLNGAPLNSQTYKIWYFYSLSADDRLDNYYRDDFVAEMEEEASQTVLGSQVQINTAAFNGILNGTHTTAQAAFDKIDDIDVVAGANVTVVESPAGVWTISTSGGSGFTPLEGTGIDITPVGADYSFAVSDYIGKTEVASISGNLQGQISAITIPTSATFLADYDARYVNESDLSAISGTYVLKSGDTMTGRLSVPVVKLQTNDLTSTATSGDLFYFDDGLYFKSGSTLKELDFDSNTAGPIEKVVITDNGNGTINVPSIMVYLYSSSGWTGNYRHYHIPAITNLALTDNSINYLVANYNSGTPEYQITTNAATINNSNICLVATMSRVGTEIHWIAVDWGLATAVKLNNRQVNIRRFERSSGLALGETTGRVITIGSGVVWYGHSSYAESAVDSSSSNCDFWYHSAGNWTKSIVSTYNNTQYDNGTNLVTLSGFGTQYAVNWVYRYLDGAGLPKIAYVLGTGNYSLAQAQASTVPNIPDILNRTAILVGRIIVAQNASTAYQIDSAFTMVFAGSTVTDHNNLSGLQGGTTSEYYHLTSGEYNDLIGRTEVVSISGGLVSLTGNQTISGSKTFTNSVVLSAISGNGILLDTTAPSFGWRDITGQIIPDTGGSAPSKATFRGGTIGIYSFSSGDQCDIPFHVPHDYVPGTDVFVHVHWSHNGTSIAGNAIFTVTATTAKGFAQAIFGAEKSQTITYNTTNIATTPRYIHRVDEIQLSNNGGTGNRINTNDIEVDGLILLNVTMTTLPTIGGGSPNEVFIFQVDLHYQSTNLSTKNKAPSFYP